jgi:hypothetical protein
MFTFKVNILSFIFPFLSIDLTFSCPSQNSMKVEYHLQTLLHYLTYQNCYGPATNKWRITRQDKTRYDNSRELRVSLIHQLVLVCWRAVPQTISFYNLEPY